MIVSLFPNFLNDEREYASVERSWSELWEDVRIGRGSLSHWHQPWLSTAYLNGKRFLDGDPIFSAISETARRAIRVLQHEPESSQVEIDFWASSFGEGVENVDVLVIDCAMSEESMQIAAELMKNWMYDGKIGRNEQINEPLKRKA